MLLRLLSSIPPLSKVPGIGSGARWNRGGIENAPLEAMARRYEIRFSKSKASSPCVFSRSQLAQQEAASKAREW